MGRDETVFAMGAAPPAERRVHPSKTGWGRVLLRESVGGEPGRSKTYEDFEEAGPRAGFVGKLRLRRTVERTRQRPTSGRANEKSTYAE